MKDGISIWRDARGVPHVEAGNEADMYWGLGYVHARDRGMQVLFMRILGQGRVSELLDASDESLQIDMFFRRMNWYSKTQKELDAITNQERSNLEAYTAGVNAGFAKKVPWEMKLVGYKLEPWKLEHSVMISRMVGYLTLAQSQGEIERLFVELVQAGINREKLEALFPGILGGLDIELLKKVTLQERTVPSHLLWNTAVPRMMASNNWAVSGSKTASGKPLLANDPHLEINRLPNVWSEAVLSCNGRYVMGGTMPGAPGVLIGRTPDVAWGATYSFIDAIDSWVEHCKDGKYYREEEDRWLAFEVRKEVIKRKKKKDVQVRFFENDHGVLEGDPNQEGYYLATRWTGSESGSQVLSGIMGMWNAKTAEEGMASLGKAESCWNWVFADTEGNIGFQMSGHVPVRREGVSGFVPLPGWKKENDWQGLHSLEDLPRQYNPERGYVATANEDLNPYGKVKPINIPMGPYRADRIASQLEGRDDLTVADMCQMHYDVYSLQAERFMEVLRPLLPETPQGKVLEDWDLMYDVDSEGAFLFEEVYRELYRQTFGKNGFGEMVVDYLADETGAFIDFYDNFDRVLLSESSPWFGERSREEIFQEAAEKALKVLPKTWGEVNQFMMEHIMLGGKLPVFLGFDYGPVISIGNRATIHQGQIYRSAGRNTTFMPSMRLVADMAKDHLVSNIAGGPSDRRFSRWYRSEVEVWATGRYKTTTADGDQQKLAF